MSRRRSVLDTPAPDAAVTAWEGRERARVLAQWRRWAVTLRREVGVEGLDAKVRLVFAAVSVDVARAREDALRRRFGELMRPPAGDVLDVLASPAKEPSVRCALRSLAEECPS